MDIGSTTSARGWSRWLFAPLVVALVALPISANASPTPADRDDTAIDDPEFVDLSVDDAPDDVVPLDDTAVEAIEDDDTVIVTERGVIIVEPPMVGPHLPDDVLDVLHAPDVEPAFAPDAGSGGSEIAEALSVGQVFALHSRPGAPLTIYLDFDGHTTTGSQWNGYQPFSNNSYTIPNSFTSAAYTRDGSPTFNAQELDYIEKVWRLVAEDYAPFDVNVTTQDPGVEALRRTSSGDTQYGVRIVISATNDWLLGTSAGGVAFVGSFRWGSDTPGYVFTPSLANGFWKYVGEAAAHEAGHTVGLYHDGIVGDDYYDGHGTGANGWAPIMGVGYYEPTSQWSNGAYTGADNQQNDLAVIDSYLGRVSASGIPVAPRSTTEGLITAGGSTQEFQVSLEAGPVSINVVPAFAGNLLARMEILRGNQSIAVVSPATASGWELEYSGVLTEGAYRIRITSIGWGTADTGFTSYGSIGRFTLSIVGPGLLPAKRLSLD